MQLLIFLGVKPFKCYFCPLQFRTSGHRKAHLLVHYKEASKNGKEPNEIITRKPKPKIHTIIDAAIQEITQDKEITGNYSVNHETNLENVESLEFTPNNILAENTEISLVENIVLTDANVPTEGNNEKEINFDDLDEKTKQQIENWLKKHQNITSSLTKLSVLNCEFCGKSFKSKYFLDRHVKTHLGDKTVSCEHCGKVFMQKNQLKVHMKIHSNLRPFKCPDCSNTFSTSGNLKTHIKR